MVYIGIEKLNYVQNLNNVFSVNSYSNMSNQTFTFILYIMLFITTALNLVKLTYEMNLKLRLYSLVFRLIQEIPNIFLLMMFSSLFSFPFIGKLEEQIKEEKFINNLFLVYLRKYIITFIAFSFLFFPFRLLTLVSWFGWSEHIISFLNVLFRMIPGMLIVFIFIIGISLSFSTVRN